MDHRCGTRIPCDFRVLVMVHPAVFGPGVLLNVSISGALLQTPLVLSPLTQIELEVEGPGMGRASIMAFITRREVHQYGVAFRGANNRVIDRILRLAQSQAEAVHVATPDEPQRSDHLAPVDGDIAIPATSDKLVDTAVTRFGSRCWIFCTASSHVRASRIFPAAWRRGTDGSTPRGKDTIAGALVVAPQRVLQSSDRKLFGNPTRPHLPRPATPTDHRAHSPDVIRCRRCLRTHTDRQIQRLPLLRMGRISDPPGPLVKTMAVEVAIAARIGLVQGIVVNIRRQLKSSSIRPPARWPQPRNPDTIGRSGLDPDHSSTWHAR